MTATPAKRAAIYARVSVSRDESVSIERQIASCTKYAESQGWQVVGVPFVDDGVSATHNKPAARVGWRALLNSSEPFDVVIVWKIDRLTRRLKDFLDTQEALQGREATVVSATEPIDMSTDIGSTFAKMLAVFGELEAQTIRARVRAARAHLLKDGRAVGGVVPYGWKSGPHPTGAGFVVTQDPEKIGVVREAASMALGGASVYSIAKELNERGIPSPTGKPRWAYSTVERLLRHPILAGLTPYNPGNGGKERGSGLLRDENGLLVVNPDLAVITLRQRRHLLALLDDRTRPQRKPRAERGVTSPLLSGLASCDECGVRMHRGTTSGRAALSCPRCHQTISLRQLEPYVIKRLLDERGDEHGLEEVELDDESLELSRIEAAISDAATALGAEYAKPDPDPDELQSLHDQLDAFKEMRFNARQSNAERLYVAARLTTVRSDWEAAEDDSERRAVLAGQLASLRIARGKVGRYLDPDRVRIVWRSRGAYAEALGELHDQLEPGDTYAIQR